MDDWARIDMLARTAPLDAAGLADLLRAAGAWRRALLSETLAAAIELHVALQGGPPPPRKSVESVERTPAVTSDIVGVAFPLRPRFGQAARPRPPRKRPVASPATPTPFGTAAPRPPPGRPARRSCGPSAPSRASSP